MKKLEILTDQWQPANTRGSKVIWATLVNQTTALSYQQGIFSLNRGDATRNNRDQATFG
jgi:hypothetical protein